MTRSLLLDLYCGAGGAAVGYHRAGFDVVGVDNRPQPHYPFVCYEADALEFLHDYGSHFDAIHASPPCQDHSVLRAVSGHHGTGHLLAATRDALTNTRLPWVIENVPGAPMRTDYRLCGCMFGLPGLRRQRWFETSWRGYDLRQPCSHLIPSVDVTGHGRGRARKDRRYEAARYTQADRRAAMGIDWMNRDELAQAIPPAYTEYIGTQLLDAMRDAA
jgi:DNA (cytosine-5)-methyltransferase 1